MLFYYANIYYANTHTCIDKRNRTSIRASRWYYSIKQIHTRIEALQNYQDIKNNYLTEIIH